MIAKPLRKIFDAFWDRSSGAIAASKDADWHFLGGSGRGQSPIARSDMVLLAAFLLAAGLGTGTRCLLVNDGAVFISAGWLGNAWHL